MSTGNRRRYTRKRFIICSILLLPVALSILSIPARIYSHEVRLTDHDGGFFTIKIPGGWNIYTAGQCSQFAFVIRDRQDSLRQIFFFESVGPVYMNELQKQLDWNYVSKGGYNIPYLEMPVINPLTPGNFMRHFSEIASTPIAQKFMSQLPKLENFIIVSVTPEPSLVYGGKTALIRGLFTKNRRIGEGFFLCTVAPIIPFTGGPGGGIGYGFLISGVTASKREFPKLLPVLTSSLSSLNINHDYIDQCIQMSQREFQGIIRAGETLQETSDLIMKGWKNRSRQYDIIAEKRSDSILGFERVYDPATGNTYHVRPKFWQYYKLNRNRFEMKNLRLIPNNSYELWNKAPRPQREIR